MLPSGSAQHLGPSSRVIAIVLLAMRRDCSPVENSFANLKIVFCVYYFSPSSHDQWGPRKHTGACLIIARRISQI